LLGIVGAGSLAPNSSINDFNELSERPRANYGRRYTWSDIFKQMNRQYTPPHLRLFTDAEQGGCGYAQAGRFIVRATGAFISTPRFFARSKRASITAGFTQGKLSACDTFSAAQL
jgi:predicted metalloprotease